jgi:hypothetical protein
VNIYSPLGIDHWSYQNPQAAMSMFEECDEPVGPPALEETVAELQRWSDEAGLPVPAAAELEAAVLTHPGPFGGGIRDLYRALGVPGAADGD